MLSDIYNINLSLSVAQQIVLEDVHWSGVITPKDYKEYGCGVLTQYWTNSKNMSAWVPSTQNDGTIGSICKRPECIL